MEAVETLSVDTEELWGPRRPRKKRDEREIKRGGKKEKEGGEPCGEAIEGPPASSRGCQVA